MDMHKVSYEGIPDLESYFAHCRTGVIGHDHMIRTPFGQKKLIYADWIASGRMYQPIEEIFLNDVFPYVANTHTTTNTTGLSLIHI